MPSESLTTVLKERDITFRYKYQQFNANLKLIHEAHIEKLSFSFEITHVRAGQWSTLASVLPEEPWLPPMRGSRRNRERYPSRQTTPGLFRSWVIDMLTDQIQEWCSGYSYSSEIDRARADSSEISRARAEWRSYLNSYYYEVRAFFADKIADQLRTMTSELMEETTCTDGYENCLFFHTQSARHTTTSRGHVVPWDNVEELFIQANSDEEDDRHEEFWRFEPEFLFRNVPREYSATVRYFEASVCSECEEVFSTRVEGETYCRTCVSERLECYMCEGIFQSGYMYTISLRVGLETQIVEICEDCNYNRQQRSQRLVLQNYSYKPTPIFNGDGPLYMGMELEVARDDYASTTNESNEMINEWIESTLPFLYAKSDSSVRNGMEIVTHPFDYKWAKANFPFDKFKELTEMPGILVEHPSAGTHVHVSKNAFDTVHMWKYILFFMENKEFMGVLGGRGHTANYGPLASAGMSAMRENLLRIVKAKGNGMGLGINFGREGVNISPEHTIELRFMAGNVSPEGIKKNMQLVQAVYDFSNEVKARDAMKGALNDPGYFLGFVEDTDYQELKDFLQKSFPTPKKLERSY